MEQLDECEEEIAVTLVEDFKSQTQRLPTCSCLHICFTCRHYPILALRYGLEICVEDENEHDIAKYVEEQLVKDENVSSQIAETVTSRASGSFQWASLVIKRVLALKRGGRNTKAIQKEIQHIPQDLNDLYKELFGSIGQDEKPKSLKLMQWICFSVCPLTLDELRFAMVVDADCPYQSLQMCKNTDEYPEHLVAMERRLKTLSRGLVEVRSSQIVQFIHQSVNDFFLQDGMRLLDPSWESNDLAIGRANYRFSRSCIHYICMEEMTQYRITWDPLLKPELSFLKYATESWITHTVRAESRNVSQADLLEDLNWPSMDRMRHWIRLFRSFNLVPKHRLTNETTLLHIASRYNLKSILSAILKELKKDSIEADSKDKDGRTPLSWAADASREEIIKLLLDRNDVDVNSKDEWSLTPLSRAAERRRETVVKLLLDRGDVEADSKDENGRTPLSKAVQRGSKTVIKLLLDRKDVEVNSKDKRGRTPLWWAARIGNETRAKLLLDREDVEADSKDKERRTPLSWAAGKRHEAVVKLLLNRNDVEANSKDRDGRTPLSWAAWGGHEPVVELLLNRNEIEADSKDKDGRTPLSWAAGKMFKAQADQFFDLDDIEADTKADTKGRELQTWEWWSSLNRHEAVAKLLLDLDDVEADSKDRDGWTPLSWTAWGGNKTLVKVLLDRNDVKADSKDGEGQTPLSWAAREGHEAVVKLFRSSTATAG